MVGASVAGKKVWIIDDVITAGTAIREVVTILKNAGAQIAGVLVALDRQEKVRVIYLRFRKYSKSLRFLYMP